MRPLFMSSLIILAASSSSALLVSASSSSDLNHKTRLFRGRTVASSSRGTKHDHGSSSSSFSLWGHRDLSVISSDEDVRRTPFEVEVEGSTTIPSNITYVNKNTTLAYFGGISGITYNNDQKVYYAVTNDAINVTNWWGMNAHAQAANATTEDEQEEQEDLGTLLFGDPIQSSENTEGNGNDNAGGRRKTRRYLQSNGNDNAGGRRKTRRYLQSNDLMLGIERPPETLAPQPFVGGGTGGECVPPPSQPNCPVSTCLPPPDGCIYRQNYYVIDPTTGNCCPQSCHAVDQYTGLDCNPNDPTPPSLRPRRPRFYTLTFDRNDNAQIQNVVYLKDKTGRPYGVGEVIPQAIVYCKGRIIMALDVGPNNNYDPPASTDNSTITFDTTTESTETETETVTSRTSSTTATTARKPQIVEFNSTGHYQANFTYPDYFEFEDTTTTGASSGAVVRGFSALSVNPNEDILYAATPSGLRNDGNPNDIRIVEFDLSTRQSGRQYVYQKGTAEEDEETVVVGLVSLDENGGFVVLERSADAKPEYNPATTTTSPVVTFPNSDTTVNRNNEDEDQSTTTWKGYDATMYYAITLDALDVQSVTSLPSSSSSSTTTTTAFQTMQRHNIYEWTNVSKLEAMGPDGDGPDRRRKATGRSRKHHNHHHHHRSSKSRRRRRRRRRLEDDQQEQQQQQRKLKPPKEYEIDLIIMSDNEFQPELPTNVLQVELDLWETEVLKPDEQTEEVLVGDGGGGDDDDVVAAVDPAIWIHPDEHKDSLVLGANTKYIGVYELDGTIKQQVDNDGDALGIDVLYAFRFTESEMIDVALVSDHTNNRVNAYWIRPDQDRDILYGITDISSMPTITNPTRTAVYHSPFTGKHYAFVLSNNGERIQQMELLANNDRIGGRIVRQIELPSAAGGLVADTELGYLYVSIQNDEDRAILKYDAEPNEWDEGENTYPKTILRGDELRGDEEYVAPGGDVTGMTLYYGDQGDGYLVASVSGDSTFVVLEREKNNDYYDTFTIGANGDKDIDKTDKTEGIAITNVRLGNDFRCGLFVVQDIDNEEVHIDSINGGAQLINSNTNYKLVPFEELATNLYYYLDVDTQSWNPRRFSLVVWINRLSQSIYSALNFDRVSGRDTENLLAYLNNAVKYLYPRSSRMQQMISLIDPFENDVHRRRRLEMTSEERRQETRRRIQEDHSFLLSSEERRELKKKDCDRRRGRRLRVDVEDAEDEMKDFIEHLDKLQWENRVQDSDFNLWKGLAQAIENNIPKEP